MEAVIGRDIHVITELNGSLASCLVTRVGDNAIVDKAISIISRRVKRNAQKIGQSDSTLSFLKTSHEH
jgi:hypothetical protein